MCAAHDKPCTLTYSHEPAFTASEKAQEKPRNGNKLEYNRKFKGQKREKSG